jgi:hypothetical protein
LLSEAADEGPLLCVVDDAQWLDEASGLTVAVVARRLLAEPVGIVFAARQPGEELHHLSELEVHGVPNGYARGLISSAVRFKLDERVRDRIIAETRGHPLALRRSPGWSAAVFVRRWPAPTCCTANGCVGKIAASTRARSSARRTTHSRRWGWKPSQSELAGSCWRPARRRASGRSRRATI